MRSPDLSLEKARKLLAEDDPKGTLNALDSARQTALKNVDQEQLAGVLDLANELEPTLSGKLRKECQRLSYAVSQNIALVSRMTTAPGEASSSHEGMNEGDIPPESVPNEGSRTEQRELGDKFKAVLRDQLLPDEEILGQAQARVGEAIVVTDRRLFIIMRGLLAGQMLGQRKTRSWMFTQISNVEFNIGVTQGYLEIQPVGGTTAQGKDREDNLIRFPRQSKYVERFKAIHRLIQEKIDETHRPHAAPAAVEPDVLDQLRKLGELRDSGVLTQDEFDEKKRTLLAKLS